MPHFEKMLYDQGQLLQSYTDAYLTTKDPLFAETIDDIATYVSRDLRHKVSLTISRYRSGRSIESRRAFFSTRRNLTTVIRSGSLSQEGGFYSAEDADSYPTKSSGEKKEGAFYVWTYDEINGLLSKEVADKKGLKLSDVFCFHFTVKPKGNVPARRVRR